MPAHATPPSHPAVRMTALVMRTSLPTRLARWSASASLALLAACGGGGGSDSGDPALPAAAAITTANYQGVAAQAVEATSYLSDATGVVTGAQLAPGPQALFSFSRTQALRLGALLARSPRLLTGVTTTDTLGCSGGGSLTITATDVNGNGAVDAGDSASLRASACVEAGSTISGGLTITFNTVSGNLDTDVYNASVSISLDRLVASTAGGSATGSGQFTMAISSSGATTSALEMSVPSMTMTGSFGGVSDTITLQDYRLSSSTDLVAGRLRTTSSVSGGMASTSVAGGLVTLATLQPLVQFDSDAYPSSGQLQATGLAGSRVRLTAQSASTVLIELDANGDGVYNEASVTRAWADLV